MLASVVLLWLSFPPFDCWPLAYFALAPWVMALPHGRRRWALACAAGTGLVFWAGNLHWLSWITLVGYSAGVIYLSLYWLAAAAILRAAMRRGWLMWIVLPVVWVGLEYARSYIVSFPWFFLAHSQYQQTRLIQIADVTGQYGVSFFVAMVNGVIVDLATWAKEKGSGTFFRFLSIEKGEHSEENTKKVPDPFSVIAGAVAAVLAAAGMLAYGSWRLGQATQTPGPVIGVVQQAYPISLGGRYAPQDKILQTHLEAARGFVGRRCDLVVLPETMMPTGLNVDFLAIDAARVPLPVVSSLMERVYAPESRERYTDRELFESDYLVQLRRKAQMLGDLSAQLGCPVLAGGATMTPNPSPINDRDMWLKRNSALWFDATAIGQEQWRREYPSQPWAAWKSWPQYYSKVHLVPFSEYVPFKQSWPRLHRTLRVFVPDVMDQLEPGGDFCCYELVRPAGASPAVATAPATASTTAAATAAPASQSATTGAASAPVATKTWRLATPICYEGTISRICRDMVWQNGRKAVDILVNMSNDGWFIWQMDGGGIYRSPEHAQHLSHYCFRAVENRVPVVRAVNTGISASIDSCGRLLAQIHKGSQRTMVEGTMLLDGAAGGGDGIEHGPLVLVDSRVSVYSRIGDAFAFVAAAVTALVAAFLVWRRPRQCEEGV